MKPGAVAELKTIVDRENPDLVLCDFQKFRETTKLKHRLRSERHCHTFDGPKNVLCRDRMSLIRGMFALGQMHIWSKISKRSLWSAGLCFPEGKYFEDMYASPRLAMRAQTFYYAPRVWIGYRQREGSILSTLSVHRIAHLSEALVGFKNEFLRAKSHVGGDVKFFISYTCARNFIGVARFSYRSSDPDRFVDMIRYRDDFMNSIAMSLNEMRFEYFKRGWFLRWSRLTRCLKAANVLKTANLSKVY